MHGQARWGHPKLPKQKSMNNQYNENKGRVRSGEVARNASLLNLPTLPNIGPRCDSTINLILILRCKDPNAASCTTITHWNPYSLSVETVQIGNLEQYSLLPCLPSRVVHLILPTYLSQSGPPFRMQKLGETPPEPPKSSGTTVYQDEVDDLRP